jgi:catechol 2,3-dioxygenase-like lactoylglutathione lyase family enzyme
MDIFECLIQIFVSDLDKSLKWYQDKLCMELVSKSNEWKSATLKLSGVYFDICQPVAKWGLNWIKAKRNIGGLRGIFFYTEDISKTYHKLKLKGVKFLKPPFKTPWGEYKANFIDPDGNEFSLCQR